MTVEIKIRYWADQTQESCINLLHEMRPFSVYKDWRPDQRRDIADLLTASARSTQSAIYLIREGCPWDAEILMRSTIEATLKFIYIISDPQQFEVRMREYSRDLFDIGLLRSHEKAQEFIKSVSDPDNRDWDPIRDLILSDDELISLRANYPRGIRRDLERRWGFTGLIASLAQSDLPEATQIPTLLHTFNVASRIHHADAHGASIVLERDGRSIERRTAIHLAHSARLLSDAIHYTLMRLFAAYRFIGVDPSPVKEVYDRSAELLVQFESAYAEWMEKEYEAGRKSSSESNANESSQTSTA